jgi:amino acid adenylation domain-containing protein
MSSLPLSSAQERLWFLGQLAPGGSAHNLVAGYELTGALDVAALRRALRELVARHESLRTRFVVERGAVRQRVEARCADVLEIEDLGAVRREARRRAEAEAARPFDLAAAPLLRARLLRLAPRLHWLLLIAHHIVSDGWSLELLWEELGVLYGSSLRTEGAALPEPPLQCGDHALWEQEWLAGGALEEQLARWRQRLEGCPVLELPRDRPRPPVRSQAGRAERFEVDIELTAGLRRLGRSAGATLFMTLLAGFQVLLLRHTGQSDLVVGTPVAGRMRLETERLVACLQNTLVLRTDLGADPSVRELLRRVRVVALDAYSQQDVPFQRLVAALHPDRDPSRTPLFQVMFSLQSLPGGPPRLADLGATRLQLELGTTMHDLSLTMLEQGDRLHGRLEYSPDLFGAARVRRMADHLLRLLEGMVEDPDRPLSRLPMLSAEERRLVLEEWNRTGAQLPRGASIHGLFEEQARRSPDAVAVRYRDQNLAYRELDRRANRLASRLRALGVRPEVVVGVCLEPSPELVVGLLGVLKAGGAYLPLDPDQPGRRLQYLLEDAGAQVLLTRRTLLDRLPDLDGRVVCLDGGLEPGDAGPDGGPVDASAGGRLAYVIYTSGSTGQPKGVLVQHRGAVGFLRSMAAWPGLDAADTVLGLTRPSFDIAVLEMFGPLSVGGTLVVADADQASDPALTAEVIERQGCTLVQTTPSRWRLLLPRLGEGEGRPLKALCGGEALPADLALAIHDRFPRSWNLYGPTEATVWATMGELSLTGPRAPIGRPIPNTRIYILDRNLEPQPVGVAGEICIAGEGLARGYLGRPGLTAARFVPDPFGEAGARMYRTGDVGSYREDGNLEFLGRVDQQVKVRGHRVEPGEVEAALAAHPGVREGVVMAGGNPDETRLVAYVVWEEGREVGPGELRRHLLERLPGPMVPAVFVTLPALPLTASGKVDRGMLPQPRSDDPPGAGEPIGPRTRVELTLASLWRELLGARRVDVRDNFFELGGHSLLAVRMRDGIRESLGVDLSISEILARPVLEEVAMSVAARLGCGTGAVAGGGG